MKPVDEMNYFPMAEEIVSNINMKTGNNNKLFYRVQVAYYLAKVASMMRCMIKTHDRGELPVNIYALNLASSGFGL